MADFQLHEDLLLKIKSEFTSPHDNEPCGVLYINKGRLDFISLDNLSSVSDTFSFDPIQWAKYGRRTYMIVHGHDDNCIPSEHDILQCNIHGKPYLIFNLQTFEYNVIYPDNYNKLCGKNYIFGTQDCFEAAHRWYSIHEITLPTRNKHWKDDWWEEGHDYITQEIKDWGFIPVSNLQYGDLLIFAMGSNGIPNHLGIYLDNDDFFHHAVNRLSCIENLNPIWGKHIVGIYRHETRCTRGISRRQIW